MPPLPRGTCPICRADIALRKGSLIREHRKPGDTANDPPCPGSGRRSEERLAAIASAVSLSWKNEDEVDGEPIGPLVEVDLAAKAQDPHADEGSWPPGESPAWLTNHGWTTLAEARRQAANRGIELEVW